LAQEAIQILLNRLLSGDERAILIIEELYRRKVQMNYKIILSLILVILVVIFIIQNAAVVEIRLFFWTITLSRALVIFLVLVIGILIGWLMCGHIAHKKMKQDVSAKDDTTD
jgi:uncharacterized integral membrane protein